MNQIVIEDMEYIRTRINSRNIDGSTVLISGATGLIGKYLVRFLAQYCNCSIIAVVRDKKKAQRLWADLDDRMKYIHCDITELEKSNLSVDYIIHGACSTSSRDFLIHPAEVIHTSVEGTRRMLEFARCNPVKGFLFLSSMEVYGAPSMEDKIDEMQGTNLDTMSVRSSYPESKRLCENLCAAYFSEYHVPVRVVRLTQTFGPGVQYNDYRVFAEFARCVIEGRNIVLHTDGATKRSYLYLADACTAILTILEKGINGEAYNAANEDTYCSIRQMAELVAGQVAKGAIEVKIEPDNNSQRKFGYASELKMNLDTLKLQKIGWKAEGTLLDMYERMIACMCKDVIEEK